MTLDLEIGGGRDHILAYFDGSPPELEIQSIEGNVDSRGRILMLKCGGAVNQVRENGKWKCIAFAGVVPEVITQQIIDRSAE